jgi:hypothetical protein
MESDYMLKYQLANIRKFTVDLRHMKMFSTMYKYNTTYYRSVMQGPNHIRPRPDDNEKYSEALLIERNGAEGWKGENFLGKAWAKKKGFSFGYRGNYN